MTYRTLGENIRACRKSCGHTYRNDQRYRKRSVDGNILSNQKIEERKAEKD